VEAPSARKVELGACNDPTHRHHPPFGIVEVLSPDDRERRRDPTSPGINPPVDPRSKGLTRVRTRSHVQGQKFLANEGDIHKRMLEYSASPSASSPPSQVLRAEIPQR
jgi:hypothetical protein